MIGANVAYPTDSVALSRAAGKLMRTARRIQAAGGAAGMVMADRRRADAQWMREVAVRLRSHGKLSRDEPRR